MASLGFYAIWKLGAMNAAIWLNTLQRDFKTNPDFSYARVVEQADTADFLKNGKKLQ